MVQAKVVVRVRNNLNLEMKLHSFFICIATTFPLIAVCQNEVIGEQSILHHLEQIQAHADSLGRLIEGTFQLGDEQGLAVSCDAIVAEKEVLQSQLDLAVGQLKVLGQARVDEASSYIHMYHSEWRFAAEDWIVFFENTEVMRNRINSWKEEVASGQLPLDEKPRKQLEELSNSIEVMERAVIALAQPSCYFDGIDAELKSALRDVVLSMRDGAEVIIKILEQAQTYRQYACSTINDFGTMPFEDAMKGYIFGDQFNSLDRELSISFNVSRDLAESTAQEATDNLILNEERVRCYTWLNETMFEATRNPSILKTICPQ